MTSASDRVPPHDLYAERSVLGSMMFAPECVDDVARLVSEASFYAEPNRIVFRAIRELHLDGCTAIDLVTLAHKLNKSGDLANAGGPPYLLEVAESVPHAAHAEHYARIVREHWARRNAIAVAKDLERLAYNMSVDPLDSIGEASSKLEGAAETARQFHVPDMADDVMEAVQLVEAARDADEPIGLMTGLTSIDNLTHGIYPGQLCVIGARPGSGKTAFVVSWMRHMMAQEKRPLFFSLEMPRRDIILRVLSQHSRVPFTKLISGELDELEQFHFNEAANVLTNQKLIIDDRAALTVEEIDLAARHWQRKHQISAVFIDHMGLIAGDGKPYEKASRVIDQCLAMTKRLKLPVILLVQLNREVENRKGAAKRPHMSDLRESGKIEENARHIWMLHVARDESGKPETEGVVELHVEKNSNGPASRRINLQFDAPTMQFRNLSQGGHWGVPDAGSTSDSSW